MIRLSSCRADRADKSTVPTEFSDRAAGEMDAVGSEEAMGCADVVTSMYASFVSWLSSLFGKDGDASAEGDATQSVSGSIFFDAADGQPADDRAPAHELAEHRNATEEGRSRRGPRAVGRIYRCMVALRPMVVTGTVLLLLDGVRKIAIASDGDAYEEAAQDSGEEGTDLTRGTSTGVSDPSAAEAEGGADDAEDEGSRAPIENERYSERSQANASEQ